MDMDSQVIKKILHDEIDKKIDEFFESLKKIQIPESVDELPKNPEIVDLFNSIGVSAELLEYLVHNLDPSNKTCEECVKEAIRLEQEFYDEESDS